MPGPRDRALFADGDDTLCRRSGLVALRLKDLSPCARGRLMVLARGAKNALRPRPVSRR
jgi:hypothetical protein